MSRTDKLALEQPAAVLSGVGPRLSERLQRLGIESVGDLLCLLPLRYEDRTEIHPLGSLRPGAKTLVEADIELAEVAFRGRRVLLVRLADGTGAITMRFFHFSRSQQQNLKRGARLRCFGEVRAGATGLEMIHPEYSIVQKNTEPPSTTLTPVYPATEGLYQQRIRGLLEQVLAIFARHPLPDHLADLLPDSWPSINEAVEFLHRPPRGTQLMSIASGRHPCQRRIALEELIAHRLSLRQLAAGADRFRAAACGNDPGCMDRLRAALPFSLTEGQETALDEIVADLSTTTPMHRLLQGDVGSGKTIVAAFAALLTASSGQQVAIMAPTELLAEQHYANFIAWLKPLEIEVLALTGSITGSARDKILERIASGRAQVVVGTHALFQESVDFARLGLIIVDEQHRFGVQQRFDLKRKGERNGLSPHQLIMTATPIPRSLAMTAYADLDYSVISGLPSGRKPIQTVVMPDKRRAELVERVGEHCRRGQQAYWVCPLIEESELIDSRAAQEFEKELKQALPKLSIAMIHGRMKAADKERVMRVFKQGELHVLVATTVIEVGVDVPNATLMVVENSERMGLSQLHQLRGRVGRGETASSCVLLYKPPLSDVARERLTVLRETNDGFEVAQKDLQLRGPGEVLGTKQTGVMQLRIADLLQDADLLPTVIAISDRLAEDFPERIDPLIRRWIRSGVEYAKV